MANAAAPPAPIIRRHTLLHAALKRVLGPHVAQKGSLVAPDRLRFDFSHPKPMTPDELERVEAQVNEVIRQNSDVSTRLMPTDKAIEAGAEALFGEKYGDEVRVLTMGETRRDKPYSVELCGGTHVRRLGDIGLFTILSESAVAAGVRRIEALTSEGARRYLTHQGDLAREAAAALKTNPASCPRASRNCPTTGAAWNANLATPKRRWRWPVPPTARVEAKPRRLAASPLCCASSKASARRT